MWLWETVWGVSFSDHFTTFALLSSTEEMFLTVSCCSQGFALKGDTLFLSARIPLSLPLLCGAYTVFLSLSFPLGYAVEAGPITVHSFLSPLLSLCPTPRKLCLISGFWGFWAESCASCHNVNVPFILWAIFILLRPRLLNFKSQNVIFFLFYLLSDVFTLAWMNNKENALEPSKLGGWGWVGKPHWLICQNIILLQLYFEYII